MKLTSKFQGLSTVLMGLAIPVRVLALKPPGTIEFEALTTRGMRVPLRLSVAAAPSSLDVSMMHMLAPALAVFLRGNGVRVVADADLASLQASARAPVLPDVLRAAAVGTPYGEHNRETCVGEALVSARRALRAVGCRVPSLAHISLSGMSLEKWLDCYVLDLESTTTKARQILEELERQERMQDEFVLDFKRKATELVDEHARAFAKIAKLVHESRTGLLLHLARGS